MAEASYFTDADELEAPAGGGQEFGALIRSLVRADLEGDDAGAILRAFGATKGEARGQFALAWNDAMGDHELTGWIEASAARRERAEALAVGISPADPSPEHNTAAVDLLGRFDAWGQYEHGVIVVPGYTPLNTVTAAPGVHDVARRRLELAMKYFAQGKAPFILVSGANVYPQGTPYYEAIEMKAELVRMGMDEERIIVEARARHSTTNLRNAGRLMFEYGMRSALIATVGGGVGGSDVFGQDFYFSNPEMSTFHLRCAEVLGYRVGELKELREGRIEFVPSESVRRVNYKDAMDP